MSEKIRVSNEMIKLIDDFHNKLRSYGLNSTKTKATAILAWLVSRNLKENNELRIKIINPKGYRELKKTIISSKRNIN